MRLIVRFAVSPEEARSLRPAMPVGIAAGGGTLPAVVEWVAPEVDPPSGMVILVAALDPGARLKPGSVVRVHPASEGRRGQGAGRRSSAQDPWTGGGRSRQAVESTSRRVVEGSSSCRLVDSSARRLVLPPAPRPPRPETVQREGA